MGQKETKKEKEKKKFGVVMTKERRDNVAYELNSHSIMIFPFATTKR